MGGGREKKRNKGSLGRMQRDNLPCSFDLNVTLISPRSFDFTM